MSSRPHKHHKKGSKPRKSQSPSPIHSSDSEGDLEQDDEQLLHRYQPTSPAEWSHHRHSVTSINGRLPPSQPPSANHQNKGSYAQAQAAAVRRADINYLPPELLIHIFRQLGDIPTLYSCLRVSATWCQCAVELLWLKPQVSTPHTLGSFLSVVQPGFNPSAPDGNGEITFDSREVVVNGRWHSVENVDNNDNVNLDPHFPYARFVRRLNLSIVADELHDAHFLALSSCIRMERLTLTGCVHLTDSSLSILSNMPNLVALDLTGVVDVTDKTILIVSSSSPKIQGINLEGCKKITDVGISAISSSCPLLRRIKLCELDQITGSSISTLVKRCPLLIEIDLTGCIGMGDIAVRDIWTYSTQLRELRLASCTNVGDAAFPVPPRSTSPPVTTYSQPQPTTMFPATHQPQAASPNDSLRLPTFLPPLVLSRPLTHLRQLDLMSLRISDSAVSGIIANAPRLRYLVLAKCSMLTDNAVRSIAELGKSLQFLHLGHASAVTDAGIKTLARSCVRLRYVDLACCTSLTNESVRALCALPKLRRIGLVRVSNLTDEAVEHLTARYNTLERVHLSYCERITVGAIHLLLQRLNKLTHLSLTGVPAFRKKELQRFCRNPPSNFNDTQRETFCVYSGSGIHDLRKYLESVAPRLGDFTSIQTEDDNDPDLSNLHFGNGNGETHASESDDEQNEDQNSSPPPAPSQSSHPPQSSSHSSPAPGSGSSRRAPAMDLFDSSNGGGGLHWIARTPALPGTTRPSQRRSSSGRGTNPPSSSSTAPTAYAGMSLNVDGTGVRRRNLAGNVSNPIVGAMMQSILQSQATNRRDGSSATTGSDGRRWAPTASNGGGSALAIPGSHGMSRSRSNGGASRQGASETVARSSSSAGRRREGDARILPSTSLPKTNTSASAEGARAIGLDHWPSGSSREETVADESNTRIQQLSSDLSLTKNGERRNKARDRERSRTPLPSDALSNGGSNGSRATSPSPGTLTPNGRLTPVNGSPNGNLSPNSNGKMKRGIKGTLSAAEQFTVSLFKGKGKSRDGSASPGPGAGAGHGSGIGNGVGLSNGASGNTSPRLEKEH